MSEVSWTREQKEAILSRGQDLLLAASAGAGKTAVLTERLINMLQEKTVELDKTVVVTFTKAAAEEMRTRIGKKIDNILAGKLSAAEKTFWQKQKFSLSSALITTIHGLCSSLLRRYFYILDIAPDFRLAEEAETKLLKDEVLEELLQTAYESKEGEEKYVNFWQFSWHYAEDFADEKLKEIITKVYTFSRKQPYYERWLSDLPTMFLPQAAKEDDWENVAWGKVLVDSIEKNLATAILLLQDALDAARAYNLNVRTEKISTVMAALEEGRSACKTVKGFSDFVALEGCLYCVGELAGNAKGVETGRKKTDLEECKEAIKDINAINKIVREKYLQPLKEYFVRAASWHFLEAQEIKTYLQALSQLAKDFDRMYRERKKRNNVLDFEDLEHYTLELLYTRTADGLATLSPTAKALKDEINMVIIDEYQDVNDIQEQLLQALVQDVGKGRLFMVGDVKQSIYRFRHAEPKLFLSKYQYFSSKEQATERKILLNTNFRSTQTVIESVNSVFRTLMTGGITEIDYVKEEFLYAGRSTIADYQAAKTELVLIELQKQEESLAIAEDENESDFADSEKMNADEIQAHYTAQRIVQMVKNCLLLPDKEGKLKKISFADIAVLFRTNSAIVNFQKIFAQYSIPISGYKEQLYETVEVKILLSLLQMIDNPLQDIPCAAVLRSFFVGLSDNQLTMLRLYKKKIAAQYLWEAAENIIVEQEETDENTPLYYEIREKLSVFMIGYRSWRKRSKQCTVRGLLEEVIKETDYDRFLSTLPRGEYRCDNINILLQQAGQYEKTAYKGLFRFLQFVDKARAKDDGFGDNERLNAETDAVTFMTVHKSKGLEFPVVVIVKSERSYKKRGGFGETDFIFHKLCGAGVTYKERDKGIKRETFSLKALKIIEEEEQVADELRLLYVAMTRARERLLIIGTYKKNKDGGSAVEESAKLRKNIADRVPPMRLMRETSSWLQWLYMVAVGSPHWLITDITQDDVLQLQIEPHSSMSADMTAEVSADECTLSAEKLAEQLFWQYRKPIFTGYRKKLTVSEIKQIKISLDREDGAELFSEKRLFKTPQFLNEMADKRMSAQEIGIMHHKILQYLDYRSCKSETSIAVQLDRLMEMGVLSEKERGQVKMDALSVFFNSTLGTRLINAKIVRKEQVFVLQAAVCDVYGSNENCEENILVQGAIDCFFWEDDGWVLIDYKTDRKGNEKTWRELYTVQMNYYKKAVEKATGKKVKECYLYMLLQGKTVKL